MLSKEDLFFASTIMNNKFMNTQEMDNLLASLDKDDYGKTLCQILEEKNFLTKGDVEKMRQKNQVAPSDIFIVDFEAEKELGRGNAWITFLGKQLSKEIAVTVKILLPSLGGGAAWMKSLSTHPLLGPHIHPHLARLLEHGECDPWFYLVEEYTPGLSLLDKVIREGPLSVQVWRSLLAEALSGLSFGLEHGFSHGDVRPENFILTSSGHMKWSDFGLPKPPNIYREPCFLAPEEKESPSTPSPGSDLYRLGVLSLLALSGKLPFSPEQDPKFIKNSHQEGGPRRTAEALPALSPAWKKFLATLLSPRPTDRPATPAECEDLLEAL